jgi:hypothetical protein
MPTLSRWHVKLAFIYFIVGLSIGGLMMTGRWISLPSWVWLLRQTHVHLLTFGWITQLIIGIAYWMLPRLTRTLPRGNQTINWSVLVTLNVGLLMRVVLEPLYLHQPRPALGLLLAISGWLQAIAGVLFVINAWQRVRAIKHPSADSP